MRNVVESTTFRELLLSQVVHLPTSSYERGPHQGAESGHFVRKKSLPTGPIQKQRVDTRRSPS